MNNTNLPLTTKQAVQKTLYNYPLVQKIAQQIHQHGGQSLLVGGAVRDLLLGIEVKDLDIEIHKVSLADLETILRMHGPISTVGKSFGVLRLHGLDIDWSLPRADSSGRKPEVLINPNMSIADACRRRDLTINAMAIDLITLQLFDPFNGQEDLIHNILRTPDPTLFIEDPLRFYRVMQFIGRFDMQPDPQLNNLCKTMDVNTVSRERIEVEFEKLFLKSKQPSLGIRWIHSLERLNTLFPELYALVGVVQEPAWHPEGDVLEHTMQSLDAAAALTSYDNATKLVLMYAALCHDLGKPETTQLKNEKLTSYGHDDAGVPIAKKLLARITHNQGLIDAVCKLVRYHMMPGQFIKSNAKPPAYKRLANKLAPECTMQMLADLAYADKHGRNPNSHTPLTMPLPDIDEFLKKSEGAQVRYEHEKPILLGRDIADIIEPGPQMGEFLKRAYEIQIEQGVTDKEQLKQLVIQKR
ncbi:MAG: HD domain-containing protein [Candidatus Babeliales bacterium]|nr:HD domain-containing protein [Candidatus Babeliales bacterium]